MSMAFDVPGSVDGPMRQLDARWKLVGIIPTCIILAAVNDLRAAALGLAGALALAAAARVPPLRLARRLVPVAALLVALFVGTIFVAPAGETSWTIGPFAISPARLEGLARVFLKTMALVTLVIVLFETTPLDELAQGARGLGVPGPLILIGLLSQRYVFLLAEEFGRLRTALRVRGFRARAGRHTYRTIGQVAGTLLVRGHDRAERVHQAMLCRGFDGRFRTLHAPRTTPANLAFVAVLVLPPLALLAWERGWLPWPT